MGCSHTAGSLGGSQPGGTRPAGLVLHILHAHVGEKLVIGGKKDQCIMRYLWKMRRGKGREARLCDHGRQDCVTMGGNTA